MAIGKIRNLGSQSGGGYKLDFTTLEQTKPSNTGQSGVKRKFIKNSLVIALNSDNIYVPSYMTTPVITADTISMQNNVDVGGSYGVSWVLPSDKSIPTKSYKVEYEVDNSKSYMYAVQYKADGTYIGSTTLSGTTYYTFTVNENAEYVLLLFSPVVPYVKVTFTFKGIKKV